MLIDHERMSVVQGLMGMGVAMGLRPFPALMDVIMMAVGMAVQMLVAHSRMVMLKNRRVFAGP